MTKYTSSSQWTQVWRQFRRNRIGMAGLMVFLLFTLIGLYAPLLASSKPLVIVWQGNWYFPLFRYLYYAGFYTRIVDLFFNVLMFVLPLCLLGMWLWRRRRATILIIATAIQVVLFAYLAMGAVKDPAHDHALEQARSQALTKTAASERTWAFDLRFMSSYAQLNQVLRYQQRQVQQVRFEHDYGALWRADGEPGPMPTLGATDAQNAALKVERIQHLGPSGTVDLTYLQQKQAWLERESRAISFEIMPLIQPFHWEDDAGGSQTLNKYVHLWDLTRINRKDLTSALLFGIRVSLVVGVAAVSLSLLLGIPIGAYAGYHAGAVDIVVSRLVEIWEAMPVFFMLLMVVAITQNRSIFLVIGVLGFFGWTGFSRFVRGEVFKQRNLPYVDACRALGFPHRRIVFSHILPNAIPPVLTLLPFSIMAAITAEAGLSFLGLGEAGSSSWGVLMDEGRTAFPGESYLLWPPAIALTLFLIAIALVGDALRDALDPKMHQ